MNPHEGEAPGVGTAQAQTELAGMMDDADSYGDEVLDNGFYAAAFYGAFAWGIVFNQGFLAHDTQDITLCSNSRKHWDD